MQITLHVNSISELAKLADMLVSKLKPSDVLLLDGELGSGKTEFVRQCARAFGINDEIDSPTYCFMNSYETGFGVGLNHFDLYRLNETSELEEIGFYEDGYEPENAIAFIEWSCLFPSEMPQNALHIEFLGHGNGKRLITISASSGRGIQLLKEIEKSI